MCSSAFVYINFGAMTNRSCSKANLTGNLPSCLFKKCPVTYGSGNTHVFFRTNDTDFVAQIARLFCRWSRGAPFGFLVLVSLWAVEEGEKGLVKESDLVWKWLRPAKHSLAKPFLDLCFLNIALATSTCSTNEVSSARRHSLTLSVT